jgi:hypothetical protein
MIVRSSAAAREAALQAFADLVDAGERPGTIEVYDGAQPASADDPIRDQTLLARFTLSRPAFAAPSNGAIGAREIAAIEALAGGIGRWARISDGTGNAVADLDVSTSPEAPLVFSSVVIEPGTVISINALVLRMPAT